MGLSRKDKIKEIGGSHQGPVCYLLATLFSRATLLVAHIKGQFSGVVKI